MNLIDQRTHLFGRLVVARKQDHAAHERMQQAFAFFGSERLARNIEHDGAQRHWIYPLITTGVPAGTRSKSLISSALRILIQPREHATTIGSSSGQPWM